MSKEIYYDVSCDLKAVFAQKKDGTPEDEDEMKWDQEVEAEEEKLHPARPSVAPEEPAGFQFSFFGDEAEPGGPEEGGCRACLHRESVAVSRLISHASVSLLAEYKIERVGALKAARQPWQHDPQLNDSSSDGEEQEEEEPKDDEEQIGTVAQIKE